VEPNAPQSKHLKSGGRETGVPSYLRRLVWRQNV